MENYLVNKTVIKAIHSVFLNGVNIHVDVPNYYTEEDVKFLVALDNQQGDLIDVDAVKYMGLVKIYNSNPLV